MYPSPFGGVENIDIAWRNFKCAGPDSAPRTQLFIAVRQARYAMGKSGVNFAVFHLDKLCRRRLRCGRVTERAKSKEK